MGKAQRPELYQLVHYKLLVVEKVRPSLRGRVEKWSERRVKARVWCDQNKYKGGVR